MRTILVHLQAHVADDDPRSDKEIGQAVVDAHDVGRDKPFSTHVAFDVELVHAEQIDP